MPPIEERLKNLISSMLTMDPALRITIPQIKASEAFRFGLPPEYVTPIPLPLISFDAPLDINSISPNDLDLLSRVGYGDEEELIADLTSNQPSMAKVFYLMLTSGFSPRALDWECSIGGFDTSLPDDNYMINPSSFSFGSLNHIQPPSVPSQSPESINHSLAVPAEWVKDPSTLQFEKEYCFESPQRTVIEVMTGLQMILRHLEMQWFHPDEFMLVCKQPGQDFIVIIQVVGGTSEGTIGVQLNLYCGLPDTFSFICRSFEEVLSVPPSA